MVSEFPLPASSALHGFISPGDFVDCYGTPSDMAPRQAAEVITDFPGWVAPLLFIRRLVTAPFGLSHDGPEASDKLGPFPVVSETDDEVIAGFNDKHLDFRISVMRFEGKILLSTWVHTHNIGGKIYLRAIMPFHILIARSGAARVAQ